MTDRTPRIRGLAIRQLVITIVVCAALVAAAGGASYWIFVTEPEAEREGATRRTAALVETITVTRGDYRPRLEVLGIVEAARDIMLSPRVSGQIIRVEQAFVPGGLVRAGELLLEIDPADFERVLAVRTSELRQVEAELRIEEGRQKVARQEFELLGEDIDPANRALVLREPQIEAIRARLGAAEAAVEQAQLDLDRTRITAPFHAQIISRSANVGSQVTPGDALGRLVGVEEFWVMASVPLRHLRWLRLADGEQAGSATQIRHTTWEPGQYREARVTNLIGSVDDQTRLARVLVTVPDPLAHGEGGPPMILGTIVDVHIEGRVIPDVVRLDRAYVRQNDTVWVMVDGSLRIRSVETVFRDARYAYIRAGLEEGDDVVTTALATVSEGLELQRATASQDDDATAGRPAQ